MASKFLTAPLIILIIFSVLATAGLGQPAGDWMTISGFVSIGGTGQNLYDRSGNLIFYGNLTSPANLTGSAKPALFQGGVQQGTDKQYAYFHNGTTSFNILSPTLQTHTAYNLYTDIYGQSKANWQSVSGFGTNNFEADLTGIMGVIGLVIAVMAFAAVVGINVVGSGDNAVSTDTIIKGMAWLTMWGVFSALGYSLFGSKQANPTQFPIGFVVYFLLTTFYTIGIISSIGFQGQEA